MVSMVFGAREVRSSCEQSARPTSKGSRHGERIADQLENPSPELSEVLLRTHVRRLAAIDVAVLLVEQKARLAMEIADRTHVLVNGRTQLSGESKTLLARPDFAEVMLGRALTIPNRSEEPA
jgi:hypothetical protein